MVSEASFENLRGISPSVHPGELPDLDDLCAPLSEEEICTAISQLKNSRASGMDGITAEMIKLGGAESARWFKSLFDAIWHEEEVPEDWKSQLLIPVHKKGIRTICDNYRGIALLSNPRKIFTNAGVTCQNRKCNDISRAVFLCLWFEFSRCRSKVEKNYLEK